MLRVLLVLALVANVADAFTTHLALSQGAHEGNPFVAVLTDQLGITNGLGFKVAAGSVLLYLVYRWRLAWGLIAIGVVFGGLAVWNGVLL